jgi:hypothetical protein
VKRVGEDGVTQVDITATCNGDKILGAAKALVRT